MEIKYFFKKTYMFADSKIQDCSRCLADSKELPEQTKTTTTTDYLRLFRIFFPFQNFPHNIMTFVTLLSPSSTSSPPLLHPPKIFPFLFHFYFHFYGIFDDIGVAFSTRRVWTLLLLLLLLLQAFFNHFEKISNNVLRRWELFNTTTSG